MGSYVELIKESRWKVKNKSNFKTNNKLTNNN